VLGNRADGECVYCDTFLPVDPEPPRPPEPIIEIETVGPDAGHRFQLTAWMLPSVGAPHRRRDGAEVTGPYQLTVRAWSLPAACEIAARLPLDKWQGFGDEPAEIAAPRPGWWRQFWTALAGRAGRR
jgi:hypothetical protein